MDKANGPHLDPKRHWSRRQAHPNAQTKREKAMRQGERPDCASPEAQKRLPGTAIGRDRGRSILDASRLGLLGSSQVLWRAARSREWLAGCAIIFLCVSYSAAQPTAAGRPPSGSRGYNAPMPPTQAPKPQASSGLHCVRCVRRSAGDGNATTPRRALTQPTGMLAAHLI